LTRPVIDVYFLCYLFIWQRIVVVSVLASINVVNQHPKSYPNLKLFNV